MTQALHEEIKPDGLRAQVLCPGVVATEFHERQGLDLSAAPNSPSVTGPAERGITSFGIGTVQISHTFHLNAHSNFYPPKILTALLGNRIELVLLLSAVANTFGVIGAILCVMTIQRMGLRRLAVIGLASRSADVLEVLRALAKAHDMKWEDIERQATRKRAERGGFDRRIFLEHVDQTP
jgi:hypothetical protein